MGGIISKEVRKKMSESRKGKKNHNYGNPQGLSFSGHNHTEESRKKMSDSHKGIPMPIETRMKISNSTKGKNGNHFGIPIPDDVKQKIRDKLKGRKINNETRKKMSDSHKNKIIPDDQRERMYESQIGGFWYGNVRNDFTIRNILRRSQEYKMWKNSVLIRDEYKDVNTKEICKFPEVHHIISVIDLIKKYKIKTMNDARNCKELWDVNNGITMERKNHIKLHGYSYHTEEELEKMYDNEDIE